MKKTLKIVLYLIIGAAVGLLVSSTARSIGGDVSTDRFYMWVSIITAIVAALFIILGVFQYRRVLSVAKDYLKYMDEDSYDKYRYNKHNEIQIYSIIGFVLSLVSLAIPLITYYNLPVILFSSTVYIMSLIFLIKTTRLVSKLYPERNLPQPSDKNYTDKLLLASDEGERHIMTTALYKTFSLTQVGIFVGILILIAYSMLTGESQIFSIIVLGLLMIVSNMKYYSEIKEK
ncbi:hypothetical protein C7K38_05910 [Tetragenococcus osmophilus]|uniref:DUF3169 family protein n=1 Tax=Tetragenococcus osmophilus TaxID=526944 RepID=A0AA38CZB8_9ENTE|nr:DUF3169 family protein [Tetragenococcus osmophilus]AYW47936.1 hypothetical protein C7K38_05910 [Tetragenococcus osmophilus]GMA72417.1 DUF3169 family protein [Tetragenococcus osmophilus]